MVQAVLQHRSGRPISLAPDHIYFWRTNTSENGARDAPQSRFVVIFGVLSVVFPGFSMVFHCFYWL